jgi:hypothetical protein
MQELTYEELRDVSGGLTVTPVYAFGYAVGYGAGKGIIMAAALLAILAVGS